MPEVLSSPLIYIPLMALIVGLLLWGLTHLVISHDDRRSQGSYFAFEAEKLFRGKSSDPAVEEAAAQADRSPADEQIAAGAIRRALMREIAGRQNGPAPVFTTRQELLEKVQSLTGWQLDPKEAFDRITYVLDKLQSRIGDEYSDIATRTGWLVASQALLIASFVSLLNAERLTEFSRNILSTGIAVTGLMVSLSLALSIFFGHALVNKLKKTRGEVEKHAHAHGVPRTGVPSNFWIHRVGHFATRCLPCLALVAWALLLYNKDSFKRTDAPRAALTERVARFCNFAPGSDHLVASEQELNRLLKSIALRWTVETRSGRQGTVLLIGSTDRVRLTREAERRFGDSTGLGRARTAAVQRLVNEYGDKNIKAYPTWTTDQVLMLVTGPAKIGETGARSNKNLQGEAADRSVEVWFVWDAGEAPALPPIQAISLGCDS